MKKVELVTLHRVTNFGSLLQTYALQTAIENRGYSCEVLDFLPEGLTFFRAIWPKNGGTAVKKAIKLLPNIAVNLFQYRMADGFLKQNVRLSDKRYKSYREVEAGDINADVFMTGSDQVWNTQNNNPEADLGVYYLAFVQDKPKLAYAGSFGRTDFSDGEKKQMAKWLSRYDALSVREDTGLALLEELGISGTHVVDPTFLLTREDWLGFLESKGKSLPKEGYVFVYNLNRNKTLEDIARNTAKEYGLRIINFADTFEFVRKAKNKLFNTPLDFLACIANADYVVTDSFHGTSFSINMERQFVTVAAPRYNSRIESVLRMMRCENRLVSSVAEAQNICENRIDYSTVSPVVDGQRERSAQFLEKALYEC